MTDAIGMKDIGARYVHGMVSKEEFLAARLAEINLAEPCKGIEGCDAFLRGKLRDAFWAMDRLDREDPFWEKTNRLPTLIKLPVYATYLIRSGKDSVNAAWVLIACDMAYCRQHLDPKAWQILQQHNSLDLPFLVRSTWNSRACWGDESITAFVALAKELNLSSLLDDELTKLAESSPKSRKWVQAVRTQLYASTSRMR